jgi:hypothetical protein
MKRKLSSNQINSYCGNVVPLRLLGGPAYGKEAITWRCDADCVQITSFAGEDGGCFTDGILLTLLKPGSAVVTATLDGQEYRCQVSIREMKTACSGKHLNYYIGDLHDHTCKKHKVDEFQAKTSDYPIDFIRQIRDEGRLDFCAVSDHSVLLNNREYFRGYADAEDAGPMDLVVFPGCEAEITPREADRYGVVHKNAGEIVTVNASNYASVLSWDAFYEKFACSPFAISTLAHPQVVGGSSKGMWNFCLHKNNTPRLRQMVKLVEMGNGSDLRANLINEYVYSVALDNGFKVSTSSSSDCHGPDWGYDCFAGKTVIMAPEKSKEAFTDALLNNRVYASFTGNVKVFYSVNGIAAPATLPETSRYDFHVELGSFYEDASTVPVKCQVISDYGMCVNAVENFDPSGFDFTVESGTARYFYLRLLDSEGRKTWSPPVFTGRAIDAPNQDVLMPLEKTGFTAVDESSGADASSLLNDKPEDTWFSQGTTCSIVIDMKKEETVAGLGVYHQMFDKMQLIADGIDMHLALSHLPYAYRISTSVDGKTYTHQAAGVFRIFSGEHIVHFPQHSARFVKLEILSTVGVNSGRGLYDGANIGIAELTVYQKA